MTVRCEIRSIGAAFCLLLCSCMVAMGAEQPNILWISCEDISPLLGCYGVAGADTPNLDHLATEGTLFTHAFSCHGVCAPSRTGIITGMSPISLGANHMRSRVRLPDDIRLFPELLRKAGYYCTNNSKTDYNLDWNPKRVWDENSAKAHWKNRPRRDQPFFAVFNLTMTHESKVWPSGWSGVVNQLSQQRRHGLNDFPLPPIYPESQAARSDRARLADLITVMDAEAGRLLQELKEAGELERTVIMFWSDHGNGLPRAKRWTYDSGAHVPLIVRLPESMRAMPGALPAGSRDERMVSLVDLAPTVLGLAGVAIPGTMQGRPFLGADTHSGHKFIYGARDRLDERQDMVRTVRSHRYRYVRNFMPWLPALQHVEYGERNETLREIRRQEAAGQLPDVVRQWLVPRAPEELYDLEADPWETENLITNPELASEVTELRAACDAWQRSAVDVHLLPEALLEEESLDRDRYGLLRGPGGSQRLESLLAAAQTRFSNHAQANSPAALESAAPGVLCWRCMQTSRGGSVDADLSAVVVGAKHSSPSVRMFAAGALARSGKSSEAAEIFRQLLEIDRPALRQGVIREVDELGDAEFLELYPRLRKSLQAAATEDEYFGRLLEHAESRAY